LNYLHGRFSLTFNRFLLPNCNAFTMPLPLEDV
jgi:hypothetical protein